MGLFPKERDLNRPPAQVELRVDASAMGQRVAEVHVRLDAFLGRHLKWRSRSSIQRLVKDGWVLIDASTPEHPDGSGALEKETRPGRKLRHGSRIVVVIPPELRLPEPEGAPGELEVLYEDPGLLAVEKPAGLAVHPSGRYRADTLIQRVHAYLVDELHDQGFAPRLCHRLDLETSGIVLVARTAHAHRLVTEQFERRRVEKEYLAVVHGQPEGGEGVVDLPLGPSRTSSIGLKMAVVEDGLPARTGWRVVERHGDRALLLCHLFTGRQHQIRVHLAAIGHPIVGDKLYAHDDALFQRHADGLTSDADRRRLELPRHALHHHRLVFTSPATGELVELVSPLPEDLRRYLDEREGAAGS